MAKVTKKKSSVIKKQINEAITASHEDKKKQRIIANKKKCKDTADLYGDKITEYKKHIKGENFNPRDVVVVVVVNTKSNSILVKKLFPSPKRGEYLSKNSHRIGLAMRDEISMYLKTYDIQALKKLQYKPESKVVVVFDYDVAEVFFT